MTISFFENNKIKFPIYNILGLKFIFINYF